ncbi:hypothetical protein [Streptomyces canus]|uniref:Uncharacterized protein n=1 Tax=Streptomyces canus TaxID=58343 RepID=A0AAW8F6R1_9ACTN|nr:hypothetical protein [Streptomyces canus]MDQ0766903.1 hypothetical protein [Streptomyces canus]MDQ0905070.1 hypothetical protein [Streptomyces canus]
MAGTLLLTLCCAGPANAASDRESLVESAERAQCAADAGRSAGASLPAAAGRLLRPPRSRQPQKTPQVDV